MKKIVHTYYTIIPLILLCVFYLFKSYNFAISDFGNYYFGSYLFRIGQFSTEVYAPCHYNTIIDDLGFSFLGTYLPFTPITTLFFYLFTFFEPIIAKLIFNIISIGLFINTVIRAFKFFKLDFRYLLLFPIIFFIPIKNGILFGQFYMLLFVFITESYILYYKDKKWISAGLLSLAIIIKIFPVLILGWFLFTKDIKQIFRVFIIGSLLLITSVLINGFEIWKFYFFEILMPSLNGAMGLDYSLNYQSMHIFLKYLFVEDSYFNKNPLVDNYNLYLYFYIFFKALIITSVIIMHYLIKNKHLQFGIWIYVSLLLSPNGSTYSLLLILFLLLALLSDELTYSIKRNFIMITSVLIICNIPWNLFQSNILVFKFLRLFFLLFLFVLIFKCYIKNIPIIKFSIILSILIGFQLLKPFPKKQYAETIYGGKSIICNYETVNEHLIIEEFLPQGKIKKNILRVEIKKSTDSVFLKDNQIFLNKERITNTKDYKLNPKIINNKIFFLSDFNQGYKFYNLNCIDIPNSSL